jgi:cytochrome oxidase Cu insertion factor (SCO1/SenC/PrrC family)
MRDESPGRWSPPRYALVALAVVVGVLVGLVAAVLHGGRAPAAAPGPVHAQVTWAPGARSAPAFSLPDQRERTVSLRSLRGRPIALTFLDSRCTRECPVEGRVLGQVLEQVRGTDAALVVVSVDPWADTPASARAFAARAHWRGDWHWLLGRRVALAPVWRAFHVAVERVPGDILHDVALYVIDPHGDLRDAYLFPFTADAVASNLRSLSD